MNSEEHKKTLKILSNKVKMTKKIIRNDSKISNIFRQINKSSNNDLDKIIFLSKERINLAKRGNEITQNFKKYFGDEIKMKNSLSSKSIYTKSNEINIEKNKFKKSQIDIKEDNKEMKKIFDKLRQDINPVKDLNKVFGTIKEIPNDNKYKKYNNLKGKDALNKISNIMREEQINFNNNVKDYVGTTTKYLNNNQFNRVEKRNMINLKLEKISNSFRLLRGYRKQLINETNINEDISNLKNKIVNSLMKSLSLSNNKLIDKEENNNVIKEKDSLNIVKEEITNNKTLRNKHLNKVNRINELFNFSLPNLSEYSSIINQKYRKKYLIRNLKKPEFNDEVSPEEEKKTQRNNLMTNKFFNNMLMIYKEKSLEWKRKDELKKEKLKNKKLKSKIARNYLSQLNLRFISKFSDPYSLRDGETNESLIDISKILGNKFYSKNEMSECAKNYYNYHNEQLK